MISNVRLEVITYRFRKGEDRYDVKLFPSAREFVVRKGVRVLGSGTYSDRSTVEYARMLLGRFGV